MVHNYWERRTTHVLDFISSECITLIIEVHVGNGRLNRAFILNISVNCSSPGRNIVNENLAKNCKLLYVHHSIS
jgi:hypothetical protein